VGSGEYTAAMLDVDRLLLDGRSPRYVQIPTAAAQEGEARLSYWINLGRRHAERLGVTAVPLVIRNRAEADDPDLAARIDGAGLVYLSGGDPLYLAETLRDTAVWRRIEAAWRDGTALAGCSAGAMALAGWVPDIRRPTRRGQPGLGVVGQLRVLPHFDRFLGRWPDLLTRPFLRVNDGFTTVGIDEDTALVGGPESFTVHGRQSVWLLGNGGRQQVPPGAEVTFPAAATAP
jgi:cyanophycinase